MLGAEKKPETLLPQKPWGPEVLEMREKVRAGDRRCRNDGLEDQGGRRARSCQEQTKVKEEQSEAASGLPRAGEGSPKRCYGWGDWGLHNQCFTFL